jgi:hypothetical protein
MWEKDRCMARAGNAFGGNRLEPRWQPFLGDALPAGVGTAFHGAASKSTECASTIGSGTPARKSGCAARKVAPDHTVSWDGVRWGTTGGGLCRTSGCSGGNRPTAGWLSLVTLSKTLPALAALSRADAGFRKSLRPTASRTYETKSPNPKGV